MKHLFAIITFFCLTIGYSQDFKQEWKEVIRLELDGKVKSAHEAVDAIYKKAKRKNYNDQIIKCFFYQSKFIQVRDENAQEIIIKNLNREIKDSKGVQKALLNFVYVSILEKYYRGNRYLINQRTNLKQPESKDFLTWTPRDFDDEINKLYSVLLDDEKSLRKTSIKAYAPIFEISPYTDTKKMSVYDFLLNEVLDFEFGNLPSQDTKGISLDYFKKTPEFLAFRTDTIKKASLKKVVGLYQHNEKYCLENNNDDIIVLQYNRMKRFYPYFKDKEAYFSQLSELEASTTNAYLLQDLRIDRADYYFSITQKESTVNHFPEVLNIIEKVLSTNENPNAKAEAESLKESILGKKITLNIPSKLYQNQNYRAFINYKNVDTLKISYYKIPIDILKKLQKYEAYHEDAKHIDSDSLLQNYVNGHQAYKTLVKVLPTKNDHFQYTTEILMENLDLGNYLLYFETKNPLGYPWKKPYAYHLIQVSNLDFTKETDQDNGFDIFQVLDRRTGKPIENATVKNDDSTLLSNKNGEVNFRQLDQGYRQNTFSEIYFAKDKDTLYTSYYKTIKYNQDDDENFQGKPIVFFDRAIYRPGQKVYFKGFMFKNEDKIKSAVPFLSVGVIITDANGNEVKKFDVQTNEFGSFTGEYDIPKNVLTGEFQVEIDEPEDYENDTKYYNKEQSEHSFWDVVDFDGRTEFKFKVEEYKRPTFEIKFDKIKENYTIGDKVIIRGNAKTLAGSNLTNAKVKYDIDDYVGRYNRYNDDDDEDDENEDAEFETTTDENGDFKIEFVAETNEKLDEDENIYYNIKAAVTDINGETRTAKSLAIVGDKMLRLNGYLPYKVFQEDKNAYTITATTLNDFPLNTKGTITFFEKSQKEFLIRKNSFPEFFTIDRKEYEMLFPYEPYDKKDVQAQENKVLTIPFDTEKSKEIDLAFLKNLKLGNYKIIIEAKDKKGNTISSEDNFTLASKKEKASNGVLFTYNQIGNSKDYFVIEFNSVIPDLYITTRTFVGIKKKEEVVIQLKNGTGLVKIPKKAEYASGVQFHFATLWKGNYYNDFLALDSEEVETKLDFEIRSMRNKIEPGSIENWSFVIKNSKLQSEVLASMYDASLDQFAKQDWTMDKFRYYQPRPYISYESGSWYDSNIRFENLFFYSQYYKTMIQEPRLDWFGFDFNNKNSYLNNQYLKKVEPIASIPKNAKTVYGVVSDKSGPIPGANVTVKGTNRSTQTDFDGYYQIDVEQGETLQFSFTGYNNYTILVDKTKNIDVSLKEQSVRLEAVVVSGYEFKAKKAYSTAATTTSVPQDNAVLDMSEIVAGNVSGVSLTGTPGSADGRFGISIRGMGSMGSATEPLYVVDGILISATDFGKLNPNDIQTVSVFTNKAATALYGSRAVNGVIAISTKRGIQELEQVKTRTNFNETAFFYPNLTTDATGNVNFSFTTPESLTKWKLRLFAHNKKAETGYFQSEIISQKDIMVMPNMPRFLREKDTINLAVKVVNLTNETKSGNAILMLYDAATNNPIDQITLNKNNSRIFSCNAKQSVALNWKITIPEGVQGLRYKVIAKSGNLSDGEENILPVLTDKILITESIPIWVKGNTKRDFTLPNLKNNTSATLKNHALTVEYTSNPVWLALQSLPYLMAYEHDCSEQVFAKYYANYLAEKIISGNPKIESLFKKWKDSKAPDSKLKLNEELKSVVMAETPWLMDTESDDERNKRLALFLDLVSLKENNEKALKKVEDGLLPSGGFAWFSGGYENRYISQHILAGIGHLNTLFPADSLQFKTIVSKGIPNLDRQFVSDYPKTRKLFHASTVDLSYLYTRSFYLKAYPLSKESDSIARLQIRHCKEDWITYSLYEKGLLALIMNRFNEKDFAKKIITSLKETASNNEEIGMYWITNTNSCEWYRSNIETQALLIEAFAEIDKDKETVDAMKVWLIKNKQAKNWPTTKATTEAVYALLYQGNDWASLKENTKIKIGDEKILTQKLAKKDDEMDSGYLKIKYDAAEINSKMGTITVENKTKAPGFGGVYWQYFETLENIKSDSTKTLSIDKKLYKKVKVAGGEQLVALNNEILKVGDLITVRLTIRANTDLDFVHLKDLRASCLEPVDVISKYDWKDGLGFYKSTKDVATNFFFDTIKKGTYILEYDLRVTNTGVFNNGISTLQSMYAPEFGTHSVNTKINVTE